jgi:hypothetical protein
MPSKAASNSFCSANRNVNEPKCFGTSMEEILTLVPYQVHVTELREAESTCMRVTTVHQGAQDSGRTITNYHIHT